MQTALNGVLEGDLNAGRLAPAIIELDADGTLINSWGDAKLLDPRLSMDAAPTATGDAARQALLAALAKMR